LEHNIRAQIWDVATGKQLVDFPAYAADRVMRLGHLAFSPDGKKLAAAATASALRVWDIARGREDPEMTQTHHDSICCVAFSPDGRTLATGSADHTIALWDADTGKQRRCLRGHEGQVASVAFSPDGKLLASAASLDDQTVRLWDVSNGKELRRFSVPAESMGKGRSRGVSTWIAFTANGKVLAAGGTDRKVRLWESATGKELLNREVRGLPARSNQGTNDWEEDVHEVAFSADGRVLAFKIGSTVHIVDVAAGQRLFPFEKDRGVIPPIGLSPDGRTMASTGGANFLRLVEIASGKDLQKIELPEKSGALKLAFAPDGRTIAGAEWIAGTLWDVGRIFLFDVRMGKQLLRLQGAASDVQELAFSPDGHKLASAQKDGTALVWDVSAARQKLPTRGRTSDDLDRLWADLRDAEAAKAHAALWMLVAAPDKAVPFLQEHLHPVPRVSAERLYRLIADLDRDDLARREEASRELAKLASEAEPALRKALEGKPSLELRRRVEALRDDLACQTEMTPDALRQVRAIQVLEQIGSPQARRILSSLAQGAPAAPATRHAAAALQRLDLGASGL
jgi:WD40 repeat protein